MGMQLRVIGTARRLAEHRHRQPAGLGMQAAAVGTDARRRRVLLDHRHRCSDCGVVAFGEGVVTGEAPQHRQRLRRRERRVVAGDSSDGVAVLVEAIHQLATEEHAGGRVQARQERFEGLGRHLTGQAESRRLGPGPHTRQLTIGLGEVAGVVGRRCSSPGRVQRRHSDHDHSHLRAGTCLETEERAKRETSTGRGLRPREGGRAGRTSGGRTETDEQQRRRRRRRRRREEQRCRGEEQARGRRASTGRRARGRRRGRRGDTNRPRRHRSGSGLGMRRSHRDREGARRRESRCLSRVRATTPANGSTPAQRRGRRRRWSVAASPRAPPTPWDRRGGEARVTQARA